MNPSFWLNRKVLVTGHTGFKGGWLSLWLQQLGAKVTGYSLPPPTSPSLFEVAEVGLRMDSRIGDVRDLDTVKALVSEIKPDVIFHLAAQPLVRYSYDHPVETYTTNLIGSLNLLEAVRHSGGVRAVVMVTSDKCYENNATRSAPFTENSPMGGFDPYSSSKGAMELMVSSYRRSYFPSDRYPEHGTAIATVRAGNVIGGGDWAADRLVPDAIQAFANNQPVTIRNPQATRPWQHVLDPLSGYLLLAQQLFNTGTDLAEGWNFGPSARDEQTVGWIMDRLTQLWGNGAAWQTSEDQHPHEAMQLTLDCSKALQRLNWQPRWDIEQGLKATIAWYKDLQDYSSSVYNLTCDQIGQYERYRLPHCRT